MVLAFLDVVIIYGRQIMGVPGVGSSDWSEQLVLLKKARFAIWIWLYSSIEVSRRSQGKHCQASPCRRLLCTPSLRPLLSPVQSQFSCPREDTESKDTRHRRTQFAIPGDEEQAQTLKSSVPEISRKVQ